MKREIVVAPNEILTTPTQPVEMIDESLDELMDEMYRIMVDGDGVGIAAPQVGSNQRVALVQLEEDDELFTLINPVIQEKNGKDIFVEGCLSVPGVYGTVERAEDIVVDYHDENGDRVRMEAEGYLARAIQHEVDHLDGILFTEKIIERIPEEKLEEYYENYEKEHEDD